MAYTVKQQRENVAKLVARLRDPATSQGRGALRCGDSFCCLGVACDINDASKWTDDDGSFMWSDGNSGGLVTESAREPYGLRTHVGGFNARGCDVALAVMRRIRSGNFDTCLAELNDLGATFAEIADVIEAHPPGLFTWEKS